MLSKNITTITAEPGRKDIVIIREFDASRELVFKAHADPNLFVQWVGSRENETLIETFEPVSGGKYRYIQKDGNGNEMGFHGMFHEMSIDRIIQTFEFEGLPEPGHVALDTIRLEELPNNRTRLTIQYLFQSVTDRDGMIQSGVDIGVNESHDRLDEILEKMKKED